ncbi:hypothetical protein DCC39_12000 [Pueribacillus theae]|uniref:Fumarylacetoacetase-like C-terminal domain-containing protein n=1 Tax=Pueribacillus theae TaxID=2171751 RepID=A0A2U1JZ08_9BACI|nr:fumarylacetoacetate hydrolase family protein [Pueribacillus theae]PWA10003.1 hypothetical protein DCC39_12000 [Pueribacillus theae]
MKLATAVINGKPTIGVIIGETFFDLHAATNGSLPKTMLEAIRLGDDFIKKVTELQETMDGKGIPLSEIKLLAPIPRPAKNIFCVGKNYVDHAIEMGSKDDIPTAPMVFSKTPTTVIGPNERIPLHKEVTEQLDYEGELAVIIGKRGKAIKREEAMDYVFGYTIINDVTARDLQKRHKQFLIGKSLDGSCPMGPVIVHKSQITDPHDLKIVTKINGEVRQNASTSQFIFDIPELISVLSKGMTLEPGDIIATGTPSGVGAGFNPPKVLSAGDVVEITIEGIGTLANRVDTE